MIPGICYLLYISILTLQDWFIKVLNYIKSFKLKKKNLELTDLGWNLWQHLEQANQQDP